ncbi:Rossmann-like and DUF2520 domain-containing protein [Peptostreptococcus sp. D1]|uniref:Rossmann-like and DUF2520 domain-containing protein n=1 Tax=Peptostreptococcus sp. D1 TaxID=72304 RepID=UPI0008F28130|nr:Rossmann-like and DUF2520 domain-containing protein [Peptostreptococcus sp. D1]SFE67794.1 Predicted oxidoreductase, contains short-chain dehydrogenase (SDR) and DUF2520 domains [Peptostreptococcus sp. D1]
MLKIGIIGAGKVGVSLGKYLFDNSLVGFSLNGYYSKTIESANFASRFTKSMSYNNLESIVRDSNCLIIATPDGEIKNIWQQLKCYNLENKVICHCSGSLSSKIFTDAPSKKIYKGSIHPALAINDISSSYRDLEKAFFSLEGDQEFIDIFKNILVEKGNRYKIIRSDDKIKYHLSSVFVSNLFLALGNISLELLSECGFDENESFDVLSNLARLNVENFVKNGPIKALTGPVERNDFTTVKNHLMSIDDCDIKHKRITDIYRLLSLELVEIAKNKHEDRDYTNIIKLLMK